MLSSFIGYKQKHMAWMKSRQQAQVLPKAKPKPEICEINNGPDDQNPDRFFVKKINTTMIFDRCLF